MEQIKPVPGYTTEYQRQYTWKNVYPEVSVLPVAPSPFSANKDIQVDIDKFRNIAMQTIGNESVVEKSKSSMTQSEGIQVGDATSHSEKSVQKDQTASEPISFVAKHSKPSFENYGMNAEDDYIPAYNFRTFNVKANEEQAKNQILLQSLISEAQKILQKSKRVLSPSQVTYAKKMLDRFAPKYVTEYQKEYCHQNTQSSSPKLTDEVENTIARPVLKQKQTSGVTKNNEKIIIPKNALKQKQTSSEETEMILFPRKQVNEKKSSSIEAQLKNYPMLNSRLKSKMEFFHGEKRHFPALQAIDQTVEIFHPNSYCDNFDDDDC